MFLRRLFYFHLNAVGVYVGVMANASHLPRDFSRYDRNHPCRPTKSRNRTRIGLERLSPCSGSSSPLRLVARLVLMSFSGPTVVARGTTILSAQLTPVWSRTLSRICDCLE